MGADWWEPRKNDVCKTRYKHENFRSWISRGIKKSK